MAVSSLRYEPEMEQENYFYGSRQNAQEYIKTHKFIINDIELVIETEITHIEYTDDHIYLVLQGIDILQEHYIPYSSITFITKMKAGFYNRNCNDYVIEYNKIQYELNKGGV